LTIYFASFMFTFYCQHSLAKGLYFNFLILQSHVFKFSYLLMCILLSKVKYILIFLSTCLCRERKNDFPCVYLFAMIWSRQTLLLSWPGWTIWLALPSHISYRFVFLLCCWRLLLKHTSTCMSFSSCYLVLSFTIFCFRSCSLSMSTLARFFLSLYLLVIFKYARTCLRKCIFYFSQTFIELSFMQVVWGWNKTITFQT